jgi:hypothetical protein
MSGDFPTDSWRYKAPELDQEDRIRLCFCSFRPGYALDHRNCDNHLAEVERIVAEHTTQILAAIKALREQAADERVAMQERGEPLTDYSSGVLDGLDRAWLAGTKAAARPSAVQQKDDQ